MVKEWVIFRKCDFFIKKQPENVILYLYLQAKILAVYNHISTFIAKENKKYLAFLLKRFLKERGPVS